MVERINGSDESEKPLSRQRRELNLGLLIGGDHDGRTYRAAVAVAERWCLSQANCNGTNPQLTGECPMSMHCIYRQQS